MKKTLFILAALTALSAHAGDHWDSCSNASGDIKIENGEISAAGQTSDSLTFKILGKTTLKKEKETCVLKNSGQKVISVDNEISVQRIEVKAGQNKSLAYVICEAGASGIPANDECK